MCFLVFSGDGEEEPNAPVHYYGPKIYLLHTPSDGPKEEGGIPPPPTAELRSVNFRFF